MNGMDLVFNTKDLIYIISMVVGGLTAWFKLKMDKQKMETELESQKDKLEKAEGLYKEEVLSAKNGRRASKRETMEHIDKIEQTLHQRIDRVRDDNIKSYEKLENKIEGLEKKYDTSTASIIQAIQNSK
jgi:hypothetical protein